MRRLALSIAFGLICVVAFADAGAIRVSSFPNLTVADGRSTVTITAEIRQSNGRPVPDGTQVAFTTTLGSFRESIATCANGFARVVLVAGSTAGFAKITASAIGVEAAPAAVEYEFVADREALETARDYIEVVTTGYMQYAPNNRLIAAAGPNNGVTIRFRDIEVTADDVQLNTSTYELRARKAKMRIGKVTKNYDLLYIRLNQKRGYGTTTFMLERPETFSFSTKNLTGLVERENGSLAVAQPELRYGLVEINGSRTVPSPTRASASTFAFEDFDVPPSAVLARKAVVFPARRIQFQQAEILVANRSIMKLPLYQLNLTTDSPMVMDQLLNVNNSQLAVNYPYYLTLEPGQTSLLRFRTGESYGRGTSVDHGVFLDYEYNWNKGDKLDGGALLYGIGRSDWGLGLHQYQRLDSRSSMYVQLEAPQGKTLQGTTSLDRHFDGFQSNIVASGSQFRNGKDYYTQHSMSFSLEKDPVKVGHLPFKLFYGLFATSQQNTYLNRSQSPMGLSFRGSSDAVRLDRVMSLTTGFELRKQTGSAVKTPLAMLANVRVSRQASKNLTLHLSYDFVRDGFDDSRFGNHRLSLQSYYRDGRVNFNLLVGKSLDAVQTHAFGDLGYEFSRLWRSGFQYTYERASKYVDYVYVVGYRIGWREVGLTWSKNTHRIGFQLLGASLN